MPPSMNIGEVLKNEAKLKGWTIRKVSEKAGISRQSVLRAYSSEGSLLTLFDLGVKVFGIHRQTMSEHAIDELIRRSKKRAKAHLESRPKKTPKPTRPAMAKAKGRTLPS